MLLNRNETALIMQVVTMKRQPQGLIAAANRQSNMRYPAHATVAVHIGL